MSTSAYVVFHYAESPVHPGVAGGSGYVDNQIQRDRTTCIPVIHSSSIKGVVRHGLRSLADPARRRTEYGCLTPSELDKQAFGNDVGPGSVFLTDARLLLLPVPSLAGVFAWVTCHMVLERLSRDLSVLGIRRPRSLRLAVAASAAIGGNAAHVVSMDSPVVIHEARSVVLDDLAFIASGQPYVGKLAGWLAANAIPAVGGSGWARYLWHGKHRTSRLVIVSDDVFRDLSEFCLTVVERNSIDDSGTVSATGPWSEEHIPAESLLYSAICALGRGRDDDGTGARPTIDALAAHLSNGCLLHIGGTASLGRGLLSTTVYPKPPVLPGHAAPSDTSTGATPTQENRLNV